MTDPARASATTPSRETTNTTILLRAVLQDARHLGREGGTVQTRTTRTAGTVGGDWELKTHSLRSGRQDHGLRCFGDGSTATSRPEGSLLGAEQCDPDGDGQNLASKAPFPGQSGKTNGQQAHRNT
ncbi:hypothetical protein A4X13_0g9117 [Tilletia indica]|uniref:Uncharacterized protein n=1 Tax=Tilletia indica TaxID=43049 RepID=A0A8T8SBE7_9BASI|nr:hypothetical protein A4X13_0g9117 [Tilletia indica]